jgi:hypothetical protein
MAEVLHKITLTLGEGNAFVQHPLLAFSYPVKVTRSGVGQNHVALITPGRPEYTFKRSGLVAWKVFFGNVGNPGGEIIDILYTI